MLYCLIRAVIALVAGTAVASMFGFRMAGGIGVRRAVRGHRVGVRDRGLPRRGCPRLRVGSVESSSQLLLLPQLVLVLLSTGMAPAESFPAWLGPFVRTSPCRRSRRPLRGLASGHVSGAGLAVTVAWCIALMALFGGLALGIPSVTEVFTTPCAPLHTQREAAEQRHQSDAPGHRHGQTRAADVTTGEPTQGLRDLATTGW